MYSDQIEIQGESAGHENDLASVWNRYDQELVLSHSDSTCGKTDPLGFVCRYRYGTGETWCAIGTLWLASVAGCNTQEIQVRC